MILLAVAVTQVGLVGDFKGIDASSWLGSRYAVKAFSRLSQVPLHEEGVLILNRGPAGNRWTQERDSFVPTLERELATFHFKNPATRLFLAIPDYSPDGFDATTYSVEVVPLLHQAAVETGTETIELKDRKSAAEDIADSAVDYAAQKGNWHLVSVDSEELDEGPAVNAIDGKLGTYWHTRYSPKDDPFPHQITVDMGSQSRIDGFRYVPRQDGGMNGRVKKYEFYVSLDGVDWGKSASAGSLPNGSRPIAVHFSTPLMCRYFKLVALSEQTGGPYASAAEIDVLPAP